MIIVLVLSKWNIWIAYQTLNSSYFDAFLHTFELCYFLRFQYFHYDYFCQFVWHKFGHPHFSWSMTVSGDWFVARSRRKLDVKTLGYVAAIPPIINFIWILRCWNNIDTFTHQWSNGDCLFYFKSFLHWGIFDLETAWMLLYLYDVRMNRIILVCWSWSFCHSEKPLTQSRSWKVPRMV